MSVIHRRLFRELVVSERGQDLIEYALLTAGIGLAAAGTWPVIANAIGATYQGFGTATQDLWEVPNPQ